jgi:hypothetical protein
MKTVTSPFFWLLLTTAVYFVMNGAQIFETLVFVPKWTASPPHSFNMLANGSGASLKVFWTVFHSVHEVTFIIALILCWKIDPVRNWLLVLFAIHMAVRVWTVSYFAPNIIDFQKIAESPALTKDLFSRVSLWQTLNYIRVSIFIAVSIALVPICIKLFNLRLETR